SSAKGLEVGIEGLRLFGYPIPRGPEEIKAAMDAEVAKIKSFTAGRKIADLLDHQPMTDPGRRAATDLIRQTWGAGHRPQDVAASTLMTYHLVSTSLEHGHTSASAFGYVLYGLFAALGGDYPQGYEFGRLGMQINERYPDPGITVRAGNVFAHSLN